MKRSAFTSVSEVSDHSNVAKPSVRKVEALHQDLALPCDHDHQVFDGHQIQWRCALHRCQVFVNSCFQMFPLHYSVNAKAMARHPLAERITYQFSFLNYPDVHP